jgi:pimeloyl-ACP methyl ester carboxylesterase
MSRVAVGEANVAYEVQGEGDPILLLHGSTGGRRHWMFTAPAMSARNRLVLVEYGGGGETTDLDKPLVMDDLVDQVLGVADAESLDRFHVAGWSLGGVIATATALRAPERVRSAALICSWATSDAYLLFESDLWRRLLAEDPVLFQRYVFQVGFTPEWFAATGDAVSTMVEWSASELSSGAARHAELWTRIDISDRLDAIRVPVLVIGARRDQIVPFAHSKALAESIEGAELIALDCGHFVPIERPDALATALSDFFIRH